MPLFTVSKSTLQPVAQSKFSSEKLLQQQQRVLIYLKLDPKVARGPKGISRDVTDVGHYGTGDLEVSLKDAADLEAAKPFIQKAYEQVGG